MMVKTFTAYHLDGDGRYWFHDGKSVVDTVAPGLYDVIDDHRRGLYLSPAGVIGMDGIVDLPNPAARKALGYCKAFIRGDYDDSLAGLDLMKKMGIMLWGDPGTSKSVTAYQVVSYACQQGWICLKGAVDDYDDLKGALNYLRQIEPDRGILVWWEEFDEFLEEYESETLQLLDGHDQIPNTLYIMSTNYIRKIPNRFWMRMRRIPFQVEFKYPGVEERRAYFEAKIPAGKCSKVDIEEWVSKTDGYSIDQCSQVIQAVFAWGQTIDDVMADIAARHRAKGDIYEDEDD